MTSSPTPTDSKALGDVRTLLRLFAVVLTVVLLFAAYTMWNNSMEAGRRAGDCAVAQSRYGRVPMECR
jgi:hypothetical protein